MKASVFAALAAVTTGPALAQSNVSLDQHVEYYDVGGMTEEEIARSLRRDAPRSLDGFQGETTYWFSWTYNYDRRADRGGDQLCRVHGTRVEIEIVVTLPRHPRIAEASETVQETWQDFATALEGHELNHAEDFERIGSMIPAAIDGLTGPCATIEDVANAKGMEYVDLAQKSADDYDAETNHGETEGTFFPGI